MSNQKILNDAVIRYLDDASAASQTILFVVTSLYVLQSDSENGEIPESFYWCGLEIIRKEAERIKNTPAMSRGPSLRLV
jgi:hypothetical protein